MEDDIKICIKEMRGICQIEVMDGCEGCEYYITKQERDERNASQEDIGPAPRFY